jgi:ElaB/YqjD/DUF883 family membrane-anchored ribosome-binding protein
LQTKIERENVVPADQVLSRELKSLREELATVRRQRAMQSADRAAEPAVGSGTGVGAAAIGTAPAGPHEEPPTEQELRSQLRDLVKEFTDFADEAEKNISAHPAMSIVTAMLLGIVIGSLLARR